VSIDDQAPEMENANWRKVVQKQVYDILSHKYGLLIVLGGAVLIVVSAFHFGEVGLKIISQNCLEKQYMISYIFVSMWEKKTKGLD
jgi:hypothetical protein